MMHKHAVITYAKKMVHAGIMGFWDGIPVTPLECWEKVKSFALCSDKTT